MLKHTHLYILLLCTLGVNSFAEDFQPQSCSSSKNVAEKISFTSKEMDHIVNTTGLDQRSVCSFVALGSNAYPLENLKSFLLNDKGEMKNYLNQHYLFPHDAKFFKTLSEFLFSEKRNDMQQVLNTLVLSDFLYGYSVGDTIPSYMEIFLFYSSENNKGPQEQESIQKIMPYILYVEHDLLKKSDFTKDKTGEYINTVKKKTLEKIKTGKTQENSTSSSDETQSSPY